MMMVFITIMVTVGPLVTAGWLVLEIIRHFANSDEE